MGFQTNLCKDLKVLVTAGGSGIGRVIAESFASYGAQIHICDADNSALSDVKASHPDWGRSHCDIAHETQVARLFKKAAT